MAANPKKSLTDAPDITYTKPVKEKIKKRKTKKK